MVLKRNASFFSLTTVIGVYVRFMFELHIKCTIIYLSDNFLFMFYLFIIYLVSILCATRELFHYTYTYLHNGALNSFVSPGHVCPTHEKNHNVKTNRVLSTSTLGWFKEEG